MLLVIGMLSLFAAFSFRRILTEKGYPESNAWRFPIIAGVVIYGFSWLLIFAATRLFKNEAVSVVQGKSIYEFVVMIFAIILHGAIVAKLWRQIKKLPPR